MNLANGDGRDLAGGNPNYGTHAAALMTVVAHTEGLVFELGCGDYSTPLLHGICSVKKRYLLSADNNRSWLNLFEHLQSDWHKIVYVPATNANMSPWDTLGNDIHWSVVFIDHEPAMRRAVDIERLRKNSDIIVVHNTNLLWLNYEPVLQTFKYKYVYNYYTYTTTVVSDTIDVREFFK